MLNTMLHHPWFWRGVCLFIGVMGLGIFAEGLWLGGWLVWVGIVVLLIGLTVASLVTRRWE
jgi:hypothetical protein